MNFDFPDREILNSFGDPTQYVSDTDSRFLSAVFDKTPAEMVPGYESRTGEMIMSITCMVEDVPCIKKGDTFTICNVTYTADRVLQSDGYVQTIIVR